MAKSSSTDGTAGASRLPSLRGSPRRRAMMPEDETWDRTGRGEDARGVETEQPSRRGARGGVEDQVHDRGRPVTAQAGREFPDSEVQTESQQQEGQPDRGAGVDERTGRRDRRDPPSPSPKTSPASRYSATGVGAKRLVTAPSRLNAVYEAPVQQQGDGARTVQPWTSS